MKEQDYLKEVEEKSTRGRMIILITITILLMILLAAIVGFRLNY